MVEQFGFAIILSSEVRAFAFISGTTSFFVGSMRHAEELSITVLPTSANFGAHCKEISPPAENIAISGLASIASCILIRVCLSPLKSRVFPTEASEATTNNSVIGNFRSSSTFNMTVPTIPVAPTTAIFITLILSSKSKTSILINSE